jgi:Family of unknown function (DUF6338)
VSSLPPINEIKELVALFAPGMIILWPMTRVRVGPLPEFRERVVAFAVASTAYFSAVSPLFYVDGGVRLPSWAWAILHYFAAPLLIGWAVAFVMQKGWDYRVAKLLKLEFFHHIPAAWDFKFSNVKENTYVLATLKDGSRVGGVMSGDSFASSSKEERDLLIGEVWEVDNENVWKRADPLRSALLVGNEIHYIEFFTPVGD